MFRSVDDAKKNKPDNFNKPRGASGCLMVMFTDKQMHYYVVTNMHVIKGGACVVKVLFNQREPLIIDKTEDDWLTDELPDDLAIVSLDKNPCQEPICEGHFLNDDDISRFDIGIGDDVFMVGRFWGQNEASVVRFGNIAAWPARMVEHELLGKQESILVEMRSLSGYSGSPVFLYILPGIREANMWIPDKTIPDEFGYATYRAPTERFQLFFLGIDWGHIGDTAMAAVVPWYRVQALLNCPKLVAQREERDATLAQIADMDSRSQS